MSTEYEGGGGDRLSNFIIWCLVIPTKSKPFKGRTENLSKDDKEWPGQEGVIEKVMLLSQKKRNLLFIILVSLLINDRIKNKQPLQKVKWVGRAYKDNNQ